MRADKPSNLEAMRAAGDSRAQGTDAARTGSLAAREDLELLACFAAERADVEFGELVRRHLDMVYATALRRVGGDRHLAEDVAQQVFADLARKAGSLDGRTMLAGWLHRGARFASAQAVRTERRRKMHEQEAYAMNEINGTAAIEWERLRPIIDDALEELKDVEREVVLLRYFEHQSLAEVGAKFSLSADAARMRVDRALDKLGAVLAARGITSTSAALVAALTTQAGVAAPAGLAGAVMAGVLGGAGTAAITAAGVTAGAAKVAPVALGKIVAGCVAAAVGVGLVATMAVTMRGTNERTTAKRNAAPAATMAAAKMGESGGVVNARAGGVTPTPPGAPTPGPARAAIDAAREGGGKKSGRGGAVVDNSVERLDRLVGLTSEQKSAARAVFARQEEALQVFAPGEERIEKGTGIRQRTRADIRALLTPEQLAIYERTPQRLGGGAMRDTAEIAARLDKVVTLTDEQTLRAAAIYQKEIDAWQAMPVDERSGAKGMKSRQDTKAQLRALLTPEQQQKFDANPDGAEDLEERAAVVAFIKASPDITARLGAVARVVIMERNVTAITINDQLQRMKGTYTYEVQGASGTEVLTVTWTRPAPPAPLEVVKIEKAEAGQVPRGGSEAK